MILTSIVRSFLLVVLFIGGSLFSQEYDPSRFEKEIVVSSCEDPMQCQITPDGKLFFIERAGALKVAEVHSKKITSLGHVPVEMTWEVGLLGFTLDRDFASSQGLYLFFSPKGHTNTMRLARFTLKSGLLDLTSEKTLLEFTNIWTRTHQGGGLFMAKNGDLLLGTGDNMYPISEAPVDERPEPDVMDAQGTSANSMSLRGKILRIHPTADGRYTIPGDNLFPEGKEGRPEIFAMGVRNGVRQSQDPRTGFIYWGDVGQNIVEDLRMGPNGYDEINQARAAGNFGWPQFTGNNEPYHKYDFVARKVGPPFDAKAPRNDSPHNTGIRELPAPQPAFIWYPSGESKDFPALGSGGRSAMAGPVYYFDPAIQGELKLPEYFNHTLFIHDWMRNWIQAVHLDANEKIASIEVFPPGMRFRKPIDLKLAPDHTLFVIEYGDKWTGNNDAQIVRLIYRRGNRPPIAVVSASSTAGKAPLKVRFDASRSSDRDGDGLTHKWKFGEVGQATGPMPEFEFAKAGVYKVTLTTTDPNGASDIAHLEVYAGNTPPKVVIESPANGSFFDSAQNLQYRLSVNDDEEGNNEDGLIPAGRVMLETKTALRATQDESTLAPGLRLMRSTTCFGCHLVADKSVGPAYLEVSKRYHKNSSERENLARKIIAGGIGVWGKELPMPPHPQHTIEQTRQMVDWILSLADAPPPTSMPGFNGSVTAPAFATDYLSTPPVLTLAASYTDHGAQGLPPLRSETISVLHPRHKRAASCDAMKDAETVDVFEGGEGNVIRLKPGGWFRFDTMNLAGITHLACRVAPLAPGTFQLEARLDALEGPVLGSEIIACVDKKDAIFGMMTFPIVPSKEPRPVYFVARTNPPLFGLKSPPPPSGRIIDVNWIEFRDNPLPKSALAPADGKPRAKVLFITTRLDHPWQTHMYSAVTELLATELNKRPDIEAIVSPDFDWPRDLKILDGVNGIVYYSGAAGDILVGQHYEAFTNLMHRGVGFCALHFATSANKLHGDRYAQFAGGWWTIQDDSLATGSVTWKYLTPEHPILQGLKPFTMADEIYRRTTVLPAATQLIQVNIANRDDVVAWAYERPGGGRSFATTLGHPWVNWSHWVNEPFRRLVLNGIAWTLHVSPADEKSKTSAR